MWIVYGSTETIPDDPDHAYNSAFVCSPDGIVLTYQKIHPVEGAWCTPGETPMIIDTGWGKVGVDICYDTYAIPELERYYAAQGCRLILNPTATSRGFDSEAGDSTLWAWYFESRIKNIAIRDQVFVASANLAEYDDSHFTFPGGSSVFGPTGSDGSDSFATCYVGSTANQEAELACGTIDLSLATATDILDSPNFRPDLFASWYGELADLGDEAIVEANAEDVAIVSTVNFQQAFGDKEANFESMAFYVTEAAEKGTNILVFPEMALTGYACESEEGAANGQAVVDIAEPLIIETPYGAMGISICKDTYSYPELARYYMARGCVYLINPTARTGTADGWQELYQNCLENLVDQDKMIVVSADLCGEDLNAPEEQAGWDPYTGASVIVAPLGTGEEGSYVRTWGSFDSDPTACGMVTAEIDYSELRLGLGQSTVYFNPELYKMLYEGVEFENTCVDLYIASAA